MFSLTVKPCADQGIEWLETVTDMVTHVEHHHDHTEHDHDGEADDCSPFCSCACCGTHMEEAYEFPLLPEIYVSVSVQDTPYFEDFNGDHFGNHFQPPKL